MMYAFEISAAEMKNFMNKLLREAAFDEFEIREAEVQTFARFEISCKPLGWAELKPYIFGVIKGRPRPKYMKFVFSAPPALVERLNPKAAAFFLNLVFDGEKTTGVTAASEKNFTMDKSIDGAWTEYVRAFFSRHGIRITDVSVMDDDDNEGEDDDEYIEEDE